MCLATGMLCSLFSEGVVGQVEDVYQMAFDLFDQARVQTKSLRQRLNADETLPTLVRVEKLKEVDDLEQVAMRSSLGLQVAHRAGAGPTLKASFDFSFHPCFPVVVLKSTKEKTIEKHATQ